MHFLAVLIIGISVFRVEAASLPRLQDGDISHMTTPEIVEYYGYPSEVHQVQTDDGYMLTLHRIPYGKNCTQSKGAILLQHGLFSSSFDWVAMGPGTALAFVMADRCYDVWMGNSRGNFYSKKHVSLPVDSDEFWDFSWHEMGLYDMPAVIDFVVHKSKQPKIYYAGHSQGTTQMFVMGSLRPEYAEKVKAVFCLAPIAFLGHSKSLMLQVISHYQGTAGWIADALGINEFLPANGLMSQLAQNACDEEHPTVQIMCTNIVFLACGFDSQQLDYSKLPAILAHTPAGSSTKQLLHYAQSFNHGKFKQYDYGAIKNMVVYGSLNPPSYDLSKVTLPIHLYYSDNDWLAANKDVLTLSRELGHSVIHEYRVPFDSFNHLDYMWAIDGPQLVYNHMMDYMDSNA